MQPSEPDLSDLVLRIKRWGVELGFAEVRIADVDLRHAEAGLQAWLDAGRHGARDVTTRQHARTATHPCHR